jgi:hypothetical protein
VEVAQALVLERMPEGACKRCFALDVLHRTEKLQDRVTAGLFLEIADAIGEPGEVMLVGEAWDDLFTALDVILLTSRHTCPGARS